MSKFLVTGTGRSGTGYFAELFRAHGINCGHQDVFRHDTVEAQSWDWRDYEGEASFEAVPALPQLRREGVKIALVTRHPLDVISSWLSLGVFGDNFRSDYSLWHGAMTRSFPYFDGCLDVDDPVVAAAEYWCLWNNLAAKNADLVVRLEDSRERKVFECFGLKSDPSITERVSKKTNARDEDKVPVKVGWDDIPDYMATRLKVVGADFGY